MSTGKAGFGNNAAYQAGAAAEKGTRKGKRAPAKPTSYVTDARYWATQIDAAMKREDDWRKDAKDVINVYESDKPEMHSYNILYSNTETMAPALYNSTPVPVVKRRFDDPDQVGAEAAKAGERVLKYLSDDGMSEDATFDELLQAAVLSALVPGRGVTKFEYEAAITKKSAPPKADADDPSAQHAPGEYEEVESETVCGYDVPWDYFVTGYGRQWKDVPWVAFYCVMTREELIDNFGAEKGAKIPLAGGQSPSTSEKDAKNEELREGMDVVHTAEVWAIWDKASRQVIFMSPSYLDEVLKSVPDPLGLTGFFPCPKPLQLFKRVSGLTPKTLYSTYKEQAEELNTITYRINKIVRAIKVRGFYDSTIQGLEKVMEAGDQQLIAAENVAALMQGQTLEKAIWLFPIDKLVVVLQQLYLQRQQIKTVIFEITGIADIMRGSTQASETLGAQEIKQQWGTLRLKRAQKEVARYARDCLRIMSEIAVTKFNPKTLAAMTGLPYPTGQEQEMAKMLQQQVQQRAAMTGQPPPPLPPQVQQIISDPTWEQVQAVLSNDTARSFRIDIETNSTVDAEATQDKQDIAELLTAMGQFFNAVNPLVESGSMSFDVAKAMLLAIVRRFRFGPEVEDALKTMQPPPPKPNPEMMKAQLDQQRGQQEMQINQQNAAQTQRQADQEFQHKTTLAAIDVQSKQQEHQMKMRELQRKEQASVLQHQQKMQATAATTAATIITAQAAAKKANAPAPAGASK